MIIIDDTSLEVYPSQRALIFSTTAKIVIFLKTYKDFRDVFSVKNASHLPLYKDHDYAIDLIDGKQLPYGLIYSLSENKLSFF